MPYTEQQQRELLTKYGYDPDKYEIIPDEEYGRSAQPVAPPAGPSSTVMGSAFRGAKRSLLPTLAGLAGTAGTAALLGPGTQPAAAILLPLAAGLTAGIGTGYAQEKISPTTPEEAAQREADLKQHAAATVIGELLPGAIALKPSLGNVKGAFTKLPKPGVDDFNRNAIIAQRLNVGLGAGLGAVSEVGVPLVRGEEISPVRAAAATIGGALLNEPNRIGRLMGFRPSTMLRPTLAPEVRPGQGHDAPIGPPAGPYHAEGLAVSRLTPQDSRLSRVYRQYYEGREAVPELPEAPPSAASEPGVQPDLGSEVDVRRHVRPSDNEVVIGQGEESHADFETRIELEARGKEIARLEGELVQAEVQIRHLPPAERLLKQGTLNDARKRLEVEKAKLAADRVVYVTPKGEQVSPKPDIPAVTPQEKIAAEEAKLQKSPRGTKAVPPAKPKPAVTPPKVVIEPSTSTPGTAKIRDTIATVESAIKHEESIGSPPKKIALLKRNLEILKTELARITKGKPNAPDPIAQQKVGQPKRVGVPPGKEIPKDAPQVRKAKGGQTGGGSGVRGGKTTLKPLPDDWGVMVQGEQVLPDGKKVADGFVQVDQPPKKPGEKLVSGRPEALRAQGYDVPNFNQLPPGRYTVAQAKKQLIAQDADKLRMLKAELGLDLKEGAKLLYAKTPFERGMVLFDALHKRGYLVQALENAASGHGAAIEKALHQAAMIVKKLTGLDVSLKPGPGEGKGIMYQAESELATAPLETLLQHPTNRRVFDLLQKIGARQNIETGIEPSLTDEAGDVVKGVAMFKDRVIKLNAASVAEDTLAHELTHILVRDMINADDPLAMRGLALFGGSEERLTAALGTRLTEIAKLKVEGLTLKRFTEWVKDLFAAFKARWMNGTEDDFRRLLARRILRGETYQPTRLIITDPKEVAYQTLANQQQDNREGLEAALAARHIAVEHGIPGMRSVVDRIRREVHPDLGDGLANADMEAARYRGRFTNRFQAGSETLSKAEQDEAARYILEMKDTKGHPTFQPSDKVLDWFEKSYRPTMSDVPVAMQEIGKVIVEGGEGRNIHETPWYAPEMIREDIQDLLANHPRDPKAIEYQNMIVEHIAELKGISKEEAFALWETKGVAEHQIRQEGMLEYGPISRSAGLGLPAAVRETDLNRLLTRYGNRVAGALGWHKAVAGDQKVAYLAGELDQFGKPWVRPEDLPPDVRPYGRIPVVAEAVKILKGDFSPSDRFFDALSRGVKVNMMQTLTGAVDLTTWWTQTLPYIHPSRLGNIALAHLSVPKGIRDGLAMGVIQKHAMRMQSVMEGGEMKGVSRWISRFNRLADVINTITGRDGLERVTRGLTMVLGEMEAVANLSHAFNPASPKGLREHAWKFLDTFADKDWASSIGNIVKAGQPVPDELIQRMAANLVDAAQGTYSIRGLPLAALKGEISPFLSLAKWNIEKANNFQKHVWAPLLRGDIAPFLMTTAGGLIGGAAVEELREWMTKRKGAQATWKEIAEAGGEGAMYKAMALSSFSGYGGVITELAKQGMDVVEGRPVTGFRFPAVAFIAGTIERGSQAFHAVRQGENLLTTFGLEFPMQLLKDHVQMARVGLNWSVNKDEVEKSNQLRDLRTFRELRGLPTSRWAGGGRNPFLSQQERAFEQTGNVSEAIQGASQLRARALAEARPSADRPVDTERLRSLLQSYRTPAADVMPSPRSNPAQFRQYLEWIRHTQGEEAARSLLDQFAQKQRLDKLKAGLLPTLSRP